MATWLFNIHLINGTVYMIDRSNQQHSVIALRLSSFIPFCYNQNTIYDGFKISLATQKVHQGCSCSR